MSLSLALALTIFAQEPAKQVPDWSAKVTYETVAVPIERALAELGAKAGVKLEIAPAMHGPIVVVRVSDQPLKEIMNRLATVTSGTWLAEEGGAYRLVRNVAQQTREANEERATKIAEVRKAIQDFLKQHQPKAPGAKPAESRPEPGFELEGFGAAGPGMSKAIARIVAGLSPSHFVLEDEGRVVFASTQTRMQLPMSGNLGPVFAELIAEHNRAEAAKASAPKSDDLSDDEAAMREWLKQFGISDEARPVNERPAKAILAVGSGGGFMSFGGGLNLELRLYGPKGTVLLSGTQGLQAGDGTFLGIPEAVETIEEVRTGNVKPKPAPAPDDKPIELRKDSRLIAEHFGRFRGEGGWENMGVELEALVSRPDLYDPLSFGISDAMLAVGKAKNLQVVACLPDEMVSFIGNFAGEGAQTVNAFLKQLGEGRETEAEVAAGWLSVRPAKPDASRRTRFDRPSLAVLIAASKAKGAASLDDLAAYAQKNESPMRTQAAMMYIATFVPSALGGMEGMTNWNMVRFYGSLGQVQRQNLAAGGTIAFSQLSQPQRALVEKMVFGSTSKLRVRDASKTEEEEPGGFFEMMASFVPGKTKDWREEPTELMPNGLPMAGAVSLRVSTESVGKVLGPAAAEMGPFGTAGADELAMLRFLLEDPNMGPMVAGQMPKIEQLRLGERSVYRFSFHVAPDVSVEHRLQDDRIPKDAPTVSIDNLPAPMKAQIEKRLAQYKKRGFPMFPGMGTRQPPPPK